MRGILVSAALAASCAWAQEGAPAFELAGTRWKVAASLVPGKVEGKKTLPSWTKAEARQLEGTEVRFDADRVWLGKRSCRARIGRKPPGGDEQFSVDVSDPCQPGEVLGGQGPVFQVSLRGCPRKFRFPSYVVPAGDHLVAWGQGANFCLRAP
jgi:hypothetical protein